MFDIDSKVTRKMVGKNEKAMNFKSMRNQDIIEYLFAKNHSWNSLYHDCFSQLTPQLEKEIEIVLDCLDVVDETIEVQIGTIEMFLFENSTKNGYCNHLSAIDLSVMFCLPAMFYFSWKTGDVYWKSKLIESNSEYLPSKGYRAFSGSYVDDRIFYSNKYKKEFCLLIKEFLTEYKNKKISTVCRDLKSLLLQLEYDIQEYM